ncbi:hypothetical protein M422DRAFT_232459 [Sphaerobolus stellatus SS14]|uniref:Nuclear distribution protein PAC1 n=1 Tax=Sphaerobolus stellatus (strain SS14) TaxID=990650 RepID=A0A0C9UPD1_SPHS4|nr:hypothetical protein M422DRAFT_232459 [Sphaerobolus stellatus SS14]
MASVLSEKQKDDLHRSILDYLSSSGFTKTYETMKEEISGLSDFQPLDAKDSKSGLLVKKWNSVLRLTRQNMDLKARLEQAQEDLSHLSHLPPGTTTRANLDWLPRSPAKHTLSGHRDRVNSLAFHPVFSVLVTAGEDTSLKVWDWETGELERTLKGHTRGVTDCEYDSKGRNLASCSNDLFIKLWNVDNDYQNFATLRGHEHTISSVRFLPGDEKIVSASRDQSVRVWNIATTHCIKVINAHDNWVRSAIPSPDGRLILTSSNDHTARITDIETGIMKTEFRGHDKPVEVAVFVPPHAIPSVRELVRKPSNSITNKVDALGVSFVVTGGRDDTLKIWDALSGQSLWAFVGHDSWVRSIVFHPNGKYMLSAADDKVIRIWDLKTGRCTRKIEEAHSGFVENMSWGRQVVSQTTGKDSKDEPIARPINVIATCSVDKTIKIWLP